MEIYTQLDQFYKAFGAMVPQHKMIDIRTSEEILSKIPRSIPPFQFNFYKIGIKKNFKGSLFFGKTKYDTESGIVFFMKPGQIISWDELEYWQGYDVIFHPDLLKTNNFVTRFNSYSFFDYPINKALFLTENEEQKLAIQFAQLYDELNLKQIDIEMIIKLLDVIFQYSERFYRRQFETRKELYNNYVSHFHSLLAGYYSKNEINLKPNVQYFANELNITAGYLNDLIKFKTGKTTIEYINEYIIENAKFLLRQNKFSIAEISYQLGFENPSYFTRLFKQKTKLTPIEFRKALKV